MTYSDLLHLSDMIQFKGHPNLRLVINETQNGQILLQLRDDALIGVEGGRKWRISRWMTKSEVVQTALQAYLAWVEHEARESFTYKGAAIFGPHFDVEELVDLYRHERFDVRT